MGDWVEAFDERTGNTYYYNTETRESSWTRSAVGLQPIRPLDHFRSMACPASRSLL